MALFPANPKRVDPLKNFKFRVKWDGKYVAAANRVSKFTRITEVVEHREGGDPSTSRKSPGRTKYEAITIQREPAELPGNALNSTASRRAEQPHPHTSLEHDPLSRGQTKGEPTRDASTVDMRRWLVPSAQDAASAQASPNSFVSGERPGLSAAGHSRHSAPVGAQVDGPESTAQAFQAIRPHATGRSEHWLVPLADGEVGPGNLTHVTTGDTFWSRHTDAEASGLAASARKRAVERDDVEIRIGRIEVTAVQSAPPQPAPRNPARRAFSLDEYLQRRDGRAR